MSTLDREMVLQAVRKEGIIEVYEMKSIAFRFARVWRWSNPWNKKVEDERKEEKRVRVRETYWSKWEHSPSWRTHSLAYLPGPWHGID